MELIKATDAIYEELNAFLMKNEKIDGRTLANHGYVIRNGGQIIGCFVLEMQGEADSWLKQLYIEKEFAGRLPILMETILQLAKQQQAKSVYVHSHQPVLDILLEALQFHPQEEADLSVDQPCRPGNLWTYQVS